MKQSESTEALVSLEDAAPDALFASVDGLDVPLWPMFRWPAARVMQEAELGTRLNFARPTFARKVTRFVRRLAPNRFASTAARAQHDALFIVSGTTTAAAPGGLRNWLVEDFAESLSPRSLVLQDKELDDFTPRSERPTFRPTYAAGDVHGRVGLAVRRFPATERLKRDVEEIVRAVLRELPFELDEAQIARVRSYAVGHTVAARHYAAEYDRILDRIDPRLVVMQMAAYGARANVIAHMRRRGVHVAEPQHGYIGPYHGAYNFGAAMSDPRLAEGLPQTLLTFGEFWSAGVRFPGTKIAIGKPHLTRLASTHGQRVPDKSVLVLANSFARDEVIAFVRALHASLPTGWVVRVRPHPSEQSRAAELYPDLAALPATEFDLTPDALVSLAASSALFGMASTVLYEALGMGRPVFVIESALADHGAAESVFGPRVNAGNVAEVVESIVSGRASISTQTTLDEIWAPAPTKTFAAFAHSVGVRATSEPPA
jgi:hypothetical protein